MGTETSYERGDRFVRLIQVLDALLRSTNGKTTRELADELGTQVRYVQRDIKHLERAGLHIERDSQHRVSIGDRSKLPPLQFTKPEAVAVLVALRLLQQMRPRRDDALVGAVGRIAGALQLETVTSYLGTMLSALDDMPEPGVREHIEAVIVQCFADRIPCEIQYENFKGQRSTRVIRTYFLEPRPEGRTIYIYALDEKSKQMRVFRVDRIYAARDVRIAGQYTIPDDFDITDATRSSWGIWQAGPDLEEVVLRFSAEAAPRVRLTLWHPSAELCELPGGGCELRLRVASEIEMRPWVLGWGGQVEVVEPQTLRTYVAREMRGGAQMYDTHLSSG